MMDGKCREETHVFKIISPLGEMVMEICAKGLHLLTQCPTITDNIFQPNLRQPVCLINKDQCHDAAIKKHANDCVNWLKTYFTEEKDVGLHEQDIKENKDIPSLCFMEAGDRFSFSQRVWVKLAANVGQGETISYGSLAALVDSPGAARAVGSAMAHNPFQLIVPCHRVIRNGGQIGNYASGCRNSVKLWLLKYEGIEISNSGYVIPKT